MQRFYSCRRLLLLGPALLLSVSLAEAQSTYVDPNTCVLRQYDLNWANQGIVSSSFQKNLDFVDAWRKAKTPASTPTTVPTKTSTPVPTATRVATATSRPTSTFTPLPTSTRTPLPTATRTPLPTATRTAVPTATRTSVPTATKTPVPTATSSDAGVPQLALWRQQMIDAGTRICDTLKSTAASFDLKLSNTYYDSIWVFQQVRDYTGDRRWQECIDAALKVYRDDYVLKNGGKVPGYWNFSHGLALDYLENGSVASRTAAVQLSQNAAFAPDATPVSQLIDAAYSRETAYTILAYLNAEKVGEPRRARLGRLVDVALGHFDQWFYKRTAPYVRPFMVALTTQALIEYHEAVPTPELVPIIADGLNWLWANTWVPSAEAFRYTDRVDASGGIEPAPDLNLLIAPAYAWVYHQTGNTTFRDRADVIFAGGVKQAWLATGKHYNQNYRWSFSYLQWRTSPPLVR